MTIEDTRIICLSKPHTTEDMPFGDDYVCFRVGDKVFAGLPLGIPNIIQLKCDPELFDEVTEKYAGVEQAWHWHKRHWLQIHLDSASVTDELTNSLIDHAYNLVYNKLPKKVKESLTSGN